MVLVAFVIVYDSLYVKSYLSTYTIPNTVSGKCTDFSPSFESARVQLYDRAASFLTKIPNIPGA